MKQTTKYVALDVHQAITVASAREASGRVLAQLPEGGDGSWAGAGQPIS